MTSKELLIKLMEFKADAIRQKDRYLGDQYFTKEDKADIEGWSEEECADIVERMRKKMNYDLMDSSTCPFCAKVGFPSSDMSQCSNCTYGQRHGACGSQKGPYCGEDLWSLIMKYEVSLEPLEIKAYFEKLYARLNQPEKTTDDVAALSEAAADIEAKIQEIKTYFFSQLEKINKRARQ